MSARGAALEGPAQQADGRPLQLIVTGFGSFQGVECNPTSNLITALRGQAGDGSALGEQLCGPSSDLAVLEVSAMGSLEALNALHKRAAPGAVFLHLGTDKSECFHLESQAFNEADFKVPDERGLQLKASAIDRMHGEGRTHTRASTVDVDSLVCDLSGQGFRVSRSDDPGRFVCNWAYFHSLRMAEEGRCHALFLHVPSEALVAHDAQLSFVRALLSLLEDPPLRPAAASVEPVQGGRTKASRWAREPQKRR